MFQMKQNESLGEELSGDKQSPQWRVLDNDHKDAQSTWDKNGQTHWEL